jgi:hypothetical protein
MDKYIEAEASPTKEFFINMLVRDVYLKEAIIELIDNSIDGARAVREDRDYSGLYIHVKFDNTKFHIKDNCGGIALDIAQNYVFRFGRDGRNQSTGKETTGIFGIGMKRAIFKMGRHVIIDSKTENSHFSIDLDVEQWKNVPGWKLPFQSYESQKSYAIEETGTEIIVDHLYDDISLEYDKSDFETELIEHVQRRVGLDLINGVNIRINDTDLVGNNVEMIHNSEIKPVSIEYKSGNVDVKIRAGIAPKMSDNPKEVYDPKEAGWYIYCNRRLVVAADKTSLTTWKDIENTNDSILFHNNYAGFRGIVFFNSRHPECLPWNTTKTGLDENSYIYVEAKAKMFEAFYIVKGFIDAIRQSSIVDSNEEDDTEESTVIRVVASYPHVVITPENTEKIEINNKKLRIEDINIKVEPKVRISYQKPESEVQIVRDALGVRSNKAVGEMTFDYYKDAEC